MSRNRDIHFTSDCIGIEPGRVVRMRGYRFAEQSQPGARADIVVVLRAHHVGVQGTDADGWRGPNFPPVRVPSMVHRGSTHENAIVGRWIDRDRPARTPVRPTRKTPKPMITSLQTATVVDWEGDHDEDEEIEIDHQTLKRVRVRFHWDREGELPLGIHLPLGVLNKRGHTAWLRVAQAWAGDDYGVNFTPRIGSEVAVAFENGDPDRPMIIGALYDGEHPVPQDVRRLHDDEHEEPTVKFGPEHSAIHTRTSPWDDDEGVRNWLVFDDTAKKEEINLWAGRYFLEEVRGKHETKIVDGQQDNFVHRHHGEIVEGRQKLSVKKRDGEAGNRKKIVNANETIRVDQDRSRLIQGKQDILVERDHNETIGGTILFEVKADRRLEIGGERYTEIGEASKPPANDTHEVTAGAKTDTIEGTVEVRAKSLAVGRPGADGAEDQAAGIQVGDKGDGPALSAKSEDAMNLSAGKEVRIESDNDSVRIQASQSLEVKGAEATMSLDTAIKMITAAQLGAHVEQASLRLKPDKLALNAPGENKGAFARLTPSDIKLVGEALKIRASGEIDLTGGPKMIGAEGAPDGDV